jgi:hypothetical protein
LIQGVEGPRNCIKFEDPKAMLCRLLTAMEQGAALAIGDSVVGPDCKLHQLDAALIRNLIQVADTGCVDMSYDPATGTLSATIVPDCVRDMFSAAGSPCVAFDYDRTTGVFRIDVDAGCLTTEGICTALDSLVAGGTATYGPGGTVLVGKDCRTYTVAAQTLAFNPATRELTVSDGNTVIIPDKFINSFTIVGQVATITMNDGTVFQQTIPLQVDINVQSFSLANGVLTITETDGSVHTVNLPVDTKVTNFSAVGNALTLTQSDGQAWTVALPDVWTCAQTIGCLIEGQNVDINPNGTVSAGYLRDNGDGTYTWVNQDGADVYTMERVDAFCVKLLALPRSTGVTTGVWAFEAPGGPTGTVDCQLRYVPWPTRANVVSGNGSVTITPVTNTAPDGTTVTTYDLSVPPIPPPPASACDQIRALPLGVASVPGDSIEFLDPTSCQRKQLTTARAANVISSNGSVTVAQSVATPGVIQFDLSVGAAPVSPALIVGVTGGAAPALVETQSGALDHTLDLNLDLSRLPISTNVCDVPPSVLGGDNIRYPIAGVRAAFQGGQIFQSFGPFIAVTNYTVTTQVHAHQITVTNPDPCRAMRVLVLAKTSRLNTVRSTVVNGQTWQFQSVLNGPQGVVGGNPHGASNPTAVADQTTRDLPGDMWIQDAVIFAGGSATYSLQQSVVITGNPGGAVSLSVGRSILEAITWYD